MLLLKCCTHYGSKFGKLSNDHTTLKGQFSFQSQRRTMPKNVQTTVQLCSFHMLARLCSKSFKLGFSSTWTENFQMYKLGFKEEPEIKSPWLMDHGESKGVPEKTSTSSLTMWKPLTVWITTKCGKFLETGIPGHLACLLRNLYAGQEATELDMEQQTGSKLRKEYNKDEYYHPAYLAYMQRTSCEMLSWMHHKLE